MSVKWMTAIMDRMPTPQQARSQTLQERISAAIVEAAARTFAQGGESVSMRDVAAEAGIARATLYRYFPSRQALVEEVARFASRDAAARLRAARLGEVPVEEAVGRAIRALIEVGDPFVVFARERVRPDPDEYERSLGQPLRGLMDRGQKEGSIRGDVPSSWLTEALVGLVVSLLSARPVMGREDMISTITRLFLEGASREGWVE